jgi:NitT/TauT family transport system permease protein
MSFAPAAYSGAERHLCSSVFICGFHSCRSRTIMKGLVNLPALPLAAVLLIIAVLWYLAAVGLNAPQVRERLDRAGQPWTTADLIRGTWSMERPVLPTPDQILAEFWKTTAGTNISSKRNLLYHTWITASATALGFVFGTLLGIALAIGILHVRTLDRSLMPWIIASQTIPILAIGPMIIIVLGNIGLTGVIPKAIISAYLSFFPVTIGMVKGLRSPDVLQLDLMHTYNASEGQLFRKLRWPSSMPFLFASLKVSIAISLVGAIVGELPTGATAGLGARLLTGSYYGQTIQIWSALLMAAFLGAGMVYGVGGIQRLTAARMGAR